MTDDSPKVVSIHGATPHAHPDAKVIKLLEGYLERAKAGDIHAIAVAWVGGDHDTTGHAWEGCNGTKLPLGFALATLNHAYWTRQLERLKP